MTVRADAPSFRTRGLYFWAHARTFAVAPWCLAAAACSSDAAPASIGTSDGGGVAPDSATSLGARDSSPPIDGAPAPADAPGTIDSPTVMDAPGGPGRDASLDEGGGAVGPCGAPGIVLCDDFESVDIDAAKWSKLIQAQDPNSKLGLDTTRAKTGSQSLHISISSLPAAGQAMLSHTLVPAMASIYGRAYFYFGSPVVYEHASFINVGGTMPLQATDRFGAQHQHWILNYVSSSHGEQSPGGGTAISVGAWICVEWYFNGAAGEFREYLDGIEVATASAADPAKYPGPNFDKLQIGMEVYGTDSNHPGVNDLWVDALAVGTQRVGCL